MNKRTPVKQKLLYILKKEYRCTIKQLMVYFKISEIAVRKHVHELEQQGFLKKNSVKQDVGRPYYTYELTQKGHTTFPNEDSTLPLELLRDLENTYGVQAVYDVLAQRKRRENKELSAAVEGKDFDEKVETIMSLKNEKGYMIEYDQAEQGDYDIKNFNCPLISIVVAYDQVCSNEKQVLKDVLPGSDVVVKSCIAHDGRFCNWTITKPKSSQPHMDD